MKKKQIYIDYVGVHFHTIKEETRFKHCVFLYHRVLYCHTEKYVNNAILALTSLNFN